MTFDASPPVSKPPEDTQLDALEEVQVRSVDCPTSMVSGVALSDAGGTTGASTVTVCDCKVESPPGPVHVRVKVVSVVRELDNLLPEVLPEVNPVLEQLVAPPPEPQLIVTVPPYATELEETLSDAVVGVGAPHTLYVELSVAVPER